MKISTMSWWGINVAMMLVVLVMPVQAKNLSALENLQQWTSEHGNKVYFVPTHNTPMLDIHIVLPAGASQDRNLVAHHQ